MPVYSYKCIFKTTSFLYCVFTKQINWEMQYLECPTKCLSQKVAICYYKTNQSGNAAPKMFIKAFFTKICSRKRTCRSGLPFFSSGNSIQYPLPVG